MSRIKEGMRVRYSEEFLKTLTPEQAECRREMEGTVMAICGGRAQINFGSHFRASSMIELSKLDQIDN